MVKLWLITAFALLWINAHVNAGNWKSWYAYTDLFRIGSENMIIRSYGTLLQERAADTCSSHSARLPIFMNFRRTNNRFRRMHRTPFWLGLTDKRQIGVYRWINGWTAKEYRRAFFTYHTKGGLYKRCVAFQRVYARPAKGFWVSRNCESAYPQTIGLCELRTNYSMSVVGFVKNGIQTYAQESFHNLRNVKVHGGLWFQHSKALNYVKLVGILYIVPPAPIPATTSDIWIVILYSADACEPGKFQYITQNQIVADLGTFEVRNSIDMFRVEIRRYLMETRTLEDILHKTLAVVSTDSRNTVLFCNPIIETTGTEYFKLYVKSFALLNQY